MAASERRPRRSWHVQYTTTTYTAESKRVEAHLHHHAALRAYQRPSSRQQLLGVLAPPGFLQRIVLLDANNVKPPGRCLRAEPHGRLDSELSSVPAVPQLSLRLHTRVLHILDRLAQQASR